MIIKTGKSLHLQAPAKINLILRVVSRRQDGYHELETWMQKLDLCDEITLTLLNKRGVNLVCDDKELPLQEDNIAWKAAMAYLEASSRGKKYGIAINLRKRIPISAGLGGGSSDAGTILKGLNFLFADFSQDELLAMGLSLGADVPFFVSDHSAVIARGVGEKMTPVSSLSNVLFMLVNLRFPVSTQWVFEKYALTRRENNSRLIGFHKLDPNELNYLMMKNDLESVTEGYFEEITQVKKVLTEAGAAGVLMSGSGPTVFGVFPEKDYHHKKCEEIADSIHRQFGAKVFIARA